MGVALTPCTVPALGKPTFFLGPAEMEVGLGIHGEHGISKQDIKTADEVTDMLLDRVLAHALKPEAEQKRVVVLVNDLGSLTHMELAIVSRRVLSQLGPR
jgi:dihydroxyacetone kinase-like protein